MKPARRGQLTIVDTPKPLYGWKPEYARMQVSFDPRDTWLLTQAKSMAGREVTMQEARLMDEFFDLSTRKPREVAERLRPSGTLAALRAMVCGGMIICTASGCINQPEITSFELVASTPDGNIRKTYDREEGIVCYTYRDAINCMVAKPGDNQ